MDHAPGIPHEANGSPGYETRDVRIKGLLLFLGGLTLATVLVELIMLAMYGLFTSKEKEPEAVSPVTTLVSQRKELKSREDSALEKYSWANPGKTKVRIPIDRAIELIADRGLPKAKGPRTLLELQSERAKKP